jgi:hypothetical protein
MKIDFEHYKGDMIGNEMLNNLDLERRLGIIRNLAPRFGKDGNQFYYLYGENLQEGIAGFGDTAHDAMDNFIKAFYNEKA